MIRSRALASDQPSRKGEKTRRTMRRRQKSLPNHRIRPHKQQIRSRQKQLRNLSSTRRKSRRRKQQRQRSILRNHFQQRPIPRRLSHSQRHSSHLQFRLPQPRRTSPSYPQSRLSSPRTNIPNHKTQHRTRRPLRRRHRSQRF